MKRNSSNITDITTSESNDSDNSGESLNSEVQAIIAAATNHTYNPEELTEYLLKYYSNSEAFVEALEFLDQITSFSQEKFIAVQNALEKIQELDREKLIQDQAELIIKEAKNFKGDSNALYKKLMDTVDLNEKPYKPDAFQLVLEDDNNKFPPAVYNAIKSAFIDRRIGYVKERPLDWSGEKIDGITDGNQVTKAPKEENDVNVKKQRNKWMQKTGESEVGLGEDICEYIGTNLMNQIMGKYSPKLRLHKDDLEGITLLSKYIPGFQDLKDKDIPERIDLIKNSENFAIFFAANVLLGDYDVHAGNVGIVESDGKYYIARIDNGRALSYNIERNFAVRITKSSGAPQDVEGFKKTMLSCGFYTRDMFEGMEFASDLYQTTQNLDLKDMKQIIEKSIENLWHAYGEDFLDNEDISLDLKERMGIDDDVDLTEETLVDTILKNIERLNKELKELSISEMKKFFPMHPEQALKESCIIKQKNNGSLDYIALLDSLSEYSNFDLKDDKCLRVDGDTNLSYAKDIAIGIKDLLEMDNIIPDALDKGRKKRELSHLGGELKEVVSDLSSSMRAVSAKRLKTGLPPLVPRNPGNTR